MLSSSNSKIVIKGEVVILILPPREPNSRDTLLIGRVILVIAGPVARPKYLYVTILRKYKVSILS